MPAKVNIAINLIWVSIALCILASLANIWAGYISSDEFVFAIILYGALCIFPYKIGCRSNAARWVYAVLIGITILMILGGIVTDMPKFDVVATIITVPIDVYTLFCLFHSESNIWFTTDQISA